MSEAITIDSAAFSRRASALLRAWKGSDGPEDYDQLRESDCILVAMGGQNEEMPYSKSSALHTWLLGYEFPSTLIFASREGFTFVTSSSKARLLEPLKSEKLGFKLEILKRTKDEANNKEIWNDILGRIDGAERGKRIGTFPKDKAVGKFAEEWDSVFNEVKTKKGYEFVDVGPALSAVWGPKDDEELKTIKIASRMSSSIMSQYFVEEMSEILDEGKKTSHEKLAARVEDKLEDTKMWKRIKGLENADISLADWCYTPIIQSGGEYDLRTSAVSTDKRLEGADGGGVVVASMGIKFKSYCSNVGRTYLIDPHRSQQKTYAFLHELQTEIAEKYLKAGVTAKEVYNRAIDFIKAKDSKLADAFIKNVGFATGIEFRDSAYVLSPKNNRKLKKDMIFNLSVGFSDLPDPNHEGKTYSLLLIDTVRINDGPATFLTDRVRGTNDMAFYFKDDEDEKEKESSRRSPDKPAQKVTAAGKVLRNKTRGEALDESAAQKMKLHQKELAKQKHEEGLARFAGEDGEGNADNEKVFKKFESYKREHMLPAKVADLKIMVDQRAQSIILPIYGFAVPFHINTLKNVSKSDEGEYTYLRLNFVTPGQIAGKKEDVPFDDPEATFIRSMSFRSTDSYHFAELYREITDLRKTATKREAEKKELADVVEQDKLITTKGRTYTLPEVFPRPALDGKRVPGDLTIHQNGLRFSSPLRPDQKIDLLFSNMKHLFYQPCDNELIVIIHIHLKSPIMIGKKKAKDVQFYREASDVQFDETGNKKRKYRGGDEDEIELEQEERRRRSQLNKEFKIFAERIAEASDGRVTVDVPYRDLGFNGVPFRTNVLLQPTTDCLVHLTDPPFLVITLSDVEIVHLERVQFGLQSFDMVFVFSDFSRQPMHVSSIPTSSLDDVKQWLDSVDICVTEGAVNLNWGAIMKTVNEDPYDFFQEGGWGFLQAGSDDSGSSESESGSEFGSEMDDGESETDDGSDSGSDFGDSDDSGSGSFDEDEESEGEDWDELERKAAKADEKKRKEQGGGSDDEGRSFSKKSSGSKRR
ncbi:putative SPT16-general chromatin factor [Violaceomyces palustris]|uniref:SPT16-general chromatin factor n=1 Tax=Violaceomyces palustris TaxID=1673888 RepID=A0ACD0P7G8_9BASI|nr:putative SPT16-general chromatin factor [Violaceomyces palustris]